MFLRKLMLTLCVGAAALTAPDLSRPVRADDDDRWENRWRGDRGWRRGRLYVYGGPRDYDGYYSGPYRSYGGPYRYDRPRYYYGDPGYYSDPYPSYGYYYAPRVSGRIGPFGVTVW